MAEYRHRDVVREMIDDARVRVPRLQPSYITVTLGERLSDIVTSGGVVIGDDGVPLIGDPPLTSQEWIDAQVALEPHGEIPAAIIDPEDDTWLSGNLTKQGERLKTLEAVLPKKAALEALHAEATLYSTQVGSLKPGVKPDPDRKPGVVDTTDSNSPFNPARRFESEQTRHNEIEKGIKRFGVKWAQGQCAKFGVDLAGRKLVPRK
jgi:hypothetical protein